MTDMFDGPGSASGLDLKTIEGALVLIKPLSLETGISTTFGIKDAIRADVVVLDGPGTPAEYVDVLIWPLVLQGQIRSNIGSGRYNLGRLGKGQAKSGQQPPWKLGDPTDADKDTARAYFAATTKAPF